MGLTYAVRYMLYEEAKRQLKNMNHAEYEKAVKQIAKKYKI